MAENTYAAAKFKNFRSTLERVEKFLSKHHFTDCNLIGKLNNSPKIKPELSHVDCGQNRISFVEAKKKLNQSEKPDVILIGHKFGPTWSTHWVKISATIPVRADSPLNHFKLLYIFSLVGVKNV